MAQICKRMNKGFILRSYLNGAVEMDYLSRFDYKIKLVALDLDGTVLTDDKRLTLRTRKAIERAAANGTEVVFVTGRPFFGIPEVILSIKGVRYVISSNGAVVTDITCKDLSGKGSASSFGNTAGRATVYSALLDRQTAVDMVRIALQQGLQYSVYIDGMGWCEQSCFERRLERYEGTPIGDYIKQSVRSTEDILRFIQNSRISPENIWLQEKDIEARDQLYERIKSTWNVNTVLTSPTDIEIESPDAGKGKALTWLCGKLGIMKEAILAMGDNFNDLEMFSAAGLAAAMGNAPAGVKAAADLIAPGNEEDGVAAVLEQITE